MPAVCVSRRVWLAAAVLVSCTATACLSGESAAGTDDEAKESVVLASGEKAQKDHVRPQVLLPVDRLPAGRQVRFAVILDVEDGWHINTNPARPSFSQPTTVTVKAKHGTKVTTVDYPTGHDLTIEGFDEPVSVYEGRVLLFGTLNVPDAAARQTEELTVEIKFQACNEQLCLAPKTAKLIGKIPVAAAGESVKKINGKVFEKDEQEKRRRKEAQRG